MSDPMYKANGCDIFMPAHVRAGKLNAMADEFLVRLALSKKDRRAFDQLVLRYRSKIFVICMKYCRGDKDQANDICQETFIRAFNRLDQLKDHPRFYYWLSEIARNNCITHIRKERALANTHSQYGVLNQPMARDGHQWTEMEIQVIRDIIHQIDNADIRETVRLFYVEGKKTDEIAKLQGITQTNVTTRLNRFRARFRMRIICEVMKQRESRGEM